MCGAISVLVWQSQTWISNGPWSLFSSSAFETLGVNLTYFDISVLSQVMDDWTSFGVLINQIFAALCGLVVILRLFMVKPSNKETWSSIRLVILFGYLLFQFFLWVTPSCWTDMKTVVAIDIDGITNGTNSTNYTVANYTYSDGNNAASKGMVENVNIFIGYAFIGIFLTYLSNFIDFFSKFSFM